jgi:hypothetical protein
MPARVGEVHGVVSAVRVPVVAVRVVGIWHHAVCGHEMPDCGVVVAGVEIDEGRFRVVVLAREAVGRGSDW